MKCQMLKRTMKEIVVDLLLWVGCVAMISSVWTAIEIYYQGTAVTSPEDSAMAFLFSTLLWWVVRRWKKEVAEDG